jgi:hypothetical protein
MEREPFGRRRNTRGVRAVKKNQFKFETTPEEYDLLQRLADRHAAGNKTAFIRDAIAFFMEHHPED